MYWKGEILYFESDILTDICIMLIGIYNKLHFSGLNLADKKWPIFAQWPLLGDNLSSFVGVIFDIKDKNQNHGNLSMRNKILNKLFLP